MDTRTILVDLKAELNRIDRAISALEGLDGTGTLKATTASAQPAPAQPRGRRSGLTPAGRKRISEMMKARWAARRKKAAKPTSTKAGAHKPMSAATKKRLSVLAKARWAARKKAAKA
jgi:hypothetical protein